MRRSALICEGVLARTEDTHDTIVKLPGMSEIRGRDVEVINTDALEVPKPARALAEFQRHEYAVWIGKVAPEGRALDKPVPSVELARGNEIRPRPCLKAQTRQSHPPGSLEDVPEHRASHTFSPMRLLGVHGFYLSVGFGELF